MTLVNIVNVHIPNNPCKFYDDFQFEITFEVLEPLQEELEFKVVYVGSAENSDRDQTLQTVIVGPVPVGVSRFILEAKCPDPSLIPPSDALGVTVVLLQCSYKDKEFVRVGYYVNNDYQVPELSENPPPVTNFDLIVRSILAEEPRITRFSIPWDGDENADIIVDEEVDQDAMDVSGDEEDIQTDQIEESYNDNSVVNDNEDEEDDEEEEEEEDVEHDLEEDEEKFKQKRHSAANVNERISLSASTRVS